MFTRWAKGQKNPVQMLECERGHWLGMGLAESRWGQTDVQMVAILFWWEGAIGVDDAVPAICCAGLVYLCGE